MSQARVPLAVLFACGLLTACGAGAPDDTAECTDMTPGTWNATGSAFGMDMTTTTTVTGCTATFSDWDMAMSVPTGAAISGSSVTFSGDGWDDCSATLSDDGASLTGECNDGSVIDMALTD